MLHANPAAVRHQQMHVIPGDARMTFNTTTPARESIVDSLIANIGLWPARLARV